MREPYDYDPDKEEQYQRRAHERRQSPTCHCGKPKTIGESQCGDCERAEQDEMARLNPPTCSCCGKVVPPKKEYCAQCEAECD